MMKASVGLADKVIEQILELSADAQIRRRETLKGSPEYHKLSGVIVAYGKTLALLTALQQREEFFAIVSQSELSASVAVC
jgi:hypothetical protein